MDCGLGPTTSVVGQAAIRLHAASVWRKAGFDPPDGPLIENLGGSSHGQMPRFGVRFPAGQLYAVLTRPAGPLRMLVDRCTRQAQGASCQPWAFRPETRNNTQFPQLIISKFPQQIVSMVVIRNGMLFMASR